MKRIKKVKKFMDMCRYIQKVLVDNYFETWGNEDDFFIDWNLYDDNQKVSLSVFIYDDAGIMINFYDKKPSDNEMNIIYGILGFAYLNGCTVDIQNDYDGSDRIIYPMKS